MLKDCVMVLSRCSFGPLAGLKLWYCRDASGKIAFELGLAVEVLRRPGNIAIAQRSSCVQRPAWIGQVWARQRTEVGSPGCDDAVDVIGLIDGAYCHSCDADFVANAICKRCLVHSPIDRLCLTCG